MRKIVNNKQLYTSLTLSKMFRIFITNKKCKKKKINQGLFQPLHYLGVYFIKKGTFYLLIPEK